MLRTLSGYQDRMLEVTGRARTNLMERGPEAAADLDRARMEMAQLMASYQLFVHRQIFEPLIATGELDEVSAAKALKVECIALAEEFRDYTKYWASQDVAARWTDYKPIALAMIARVRSHAGNVRRLASQFPMEVAMSHY